MFENNREYLTSKMAKDKKDKELPNFVIQNPHEFKFACSILLRREVLSTISKDLVVSEVSNLRNRVL